MLATMPLAAAVTILRDNCDKPRREPKNTQFTYVDRRILSKGDTKNLFTYNRWASDPLPKDSLRPEGNSFVFRRNMTVRAAS